ncbi:MAG: fibronectin type III domain-containing protein [Actinomycetota bacterium]
MKNRRLAVAALTIALLAGSGIAFADPDPVNLVLQLITPTDVQATGIGPTTIFVAWTDNSPVETANRIEIANDEAGPYTQVAAAPACGGVDLNQIQNTKLGSTVCKYVVANLAPRADPAPRYLRVTPLIVSDPREPRSAVLFEGRASEPDPAILGPEPPTDFTCNGGGELACINVNSVTLTWTNNGDQQEFWIMRGRGAVNPYYGSTPIARLSGTTTAFHEYLQEYNKVFSYRVVAVRIQNLPRADGTVVTEMSYSNGIPDHVVVETAPLPPPTDPTGLTAQFVPPSMALLTWTDRSPAGPYIDEDGWRIEIGPASNDFRSELTRPASAGQGTVTYTNISIPPDTKRCYRVRGYRNGLAFSGFTNVACLGSIPTAPTKLVAVAVSNAQVDLSWRDNSDAEESFDIDRCAGVCSASSAGWTQIADTPPDAESFSDTGTVGLATYSYRVYAHNSSGRSAPSNISVVTTPAARVAKPDDLSAVATGSHEITLDWVDRATNETGYLIEFRRPGGEWAELAKNLGPNSHHYVDVESLGASQRRCYRVRATKGTDESSDPSDEACATTLPPQPPNGDPTGLAATVQSNTSIVLGWTDNASNESAFRVEYIAFRNMACPQDPTGIPFAKLTTAPGHSGLGAANFLVTGLVPHTAYFFRVRAENLDGVSGVSNATTCAQTFGPPLPVFKDPAESGNVSATRCDFQITAGTTAGPDRVKRLLVYVNAIVSGTNLSTTDTIEVSAADNPSPIVGPNTWKIQHQFRRGINYRLLVTSYGYEAPNWASATAEVHDIKVLADCPVEPDPLP